MATTSIGLIVLKLGSKGGALVELSNGKPVIHLTPLTVIGVLLYGISFLLYIYLLAKNDLSYIIPLTTALVYMVIFVASAFIFKESFTVLKIIGISLILAGVVLISLKK